MKLPDIREILKNRLAESDDSFFTDSVLNYYINTAQQEISKELNLLQGMVKTNLVNGQYRYNLSQAEGFRNQLNYVVIYDDDDNRVILAPIQNNNFEFWLAKGDADDSDNHSIPEEYCLFGDELFLWPPPNYDKTDGLYVFYPVTAPIVEDDNTLLRLPDNYRPLIVEYALWMCKSMDEDNTTDKAIARYWNNYQRMLAFEKGKLSKQTKGPRRGLTKSEYDSLRG